MKDRSSWFKTIAYKGYKLGKSASPDWESLYHGFDRIEMPQFWRKPTTEY